MTPTGYLAALRREGDALLAAAQSRLDDPVWSCRGWSVRDVVAHVGVVHQHKDELVRRRMVDEQPERRSAPREDDTLLGRGGRVAERGAKEVEADAEIRGSASDVFLYLRGRAHLERLMVAGDELVVERVREVAAGAGS